jgi:hypothetical protein
MVKGPTLVAKNATRMGHPSHFMFFCTDADLASWGANLPGSPVVGMSDPVEHLTQFVIPLSRKCNNIRKESKGTQS